MRLFLSIDLPYRLKQKLKKLQEKFRKEVEATFVRPSQFHSTLLFLGEVKEENLAKIKARLEAAAKRFLPFAVGVSHVGFMVKRRPLVFSVFLYGKEFSLLHDSLKESLEDLFPVKTGVERKNLPHVTLFRLKKVARGLGQRLEPLIESSSQSLKNLNFPVLSFHLMQSHLTARGPIHTRLGEFYLGKV